MESKTNPSPEPFAQVLARLPLPVIDSPPSPHGAVILPLELVCISLLLEFSFHTFMHLS